MRLALSLILGLSLPLHASIIFNNLSTNGIIPTSIHGPGGIQVQGSNFGGLNKVTSNAAAQFTPSQNYDITEFDVVIGTNSGPGDSDIILYLYSDLAGLPGVQIGSQSWAFTGPNNITNVTKVAVSGLAVTANTPYWLVAKPADVNTTALWSINDLIPSFQGLHAYSSLPLQDWTIIHGPGNSFDWGFAVQGTLTVPEPSSALLIGLGLFAIHRKFQPKKKAPRSRDALSSDNQLTS